MTPVVGINFIETEIFIKDWIKNKLNKPTQAVTLKRLLLLLILNNPLKNMVNTIRITIIHTIAPYSSAITGKIKSVCESGIYFFIVPSPGPLPNSPPSWYALIDF